MSVKAGEFFIELGLKGAEKSVSGLAQMSDHFQGLKQMTVGAKLAILAALAGMEQMVSLTGRWGNEVSKTHQHLMLTVRDLQLWENAAQRMGAGSGQMTSAFESIQKAMIGIQMGKMPPDFYPTLMALMQQGGKKIGPDDIRKWGTTMGGPVDFMSNIIGLISNSHVNRAKLQYMLQEAGISPEIYDVARMGAFNKGNMGIAGQSILRTSDVSRLNQTYIEFQTFEQELTKIGKILATTINPTLKDLNMFIGPLAKLIDKVTPRHSGVSLFDFYPGVAPVRSIVINVTGQDLSNHPKLKKAVKEGVQEALQREYISTVGKTPSARTGP